ncbi:unnamed protein product, partial [marine sediment metagenome]
MHVGHKNEHDPHPKQFSLISSQISLPKLLSKILLVLVKSNLVVINSSAFF